MSPIRGLQNGYVSELDWPLWELARHHQDPDPAQLLDLDEDVLAEVEAQDPQEAGNLDNLFITLAQLEEKVASVTVAATIVKRSKELTATTTASEVERQLQEKFHTIIRCRGLITDEPLWRKSTGRKGQTVVAFDGPGSSTSKRGRKGKDGQTEVVSAEEDSSRQPKKRKVHDAQNPFECGDCGRHFTSQRPLDSHSKTCVGRCQNCEQHGLECHIGARCVCKNCREEKVNCRFFLEDCTDNTIQSSIRARLCSKCGCMEQCSYTQSAHEDNCRGRCNACRDHTPPLSCRHAPTSYLTCTECTESDSPCNFAECHGCGIVKSSRHKCVGKCLLCSETGEICDSGMRNGCVRCEEKGETCIFFLEEHDENSEERKERERRLCTKCGTLFPNNQQKGYHEKICKGKCDECIAKGIPCRPTAAIDSRVTCACCLKAKIERSRGRDTRVRRQRRSLA